MRLTGLLSVWPIYRPERSPGTFKYEFHGYLCIISGKLSRFNPKHVYYEKQNFVLVPIDCYKPHFCFLRRLQIRLPRYCFC